MALEFVLSVAAVYWIYLTTRTGRNNWLWLFSVSYYWCFYVRLIRFGLWTRNTLQLVVASEPIKCPPPSADDAHASELPFFFILVPSYQSAESVGLVASVLARQDYPSDRWRALFVCDEGEIIDSATQAADIASEVRSALEGKRSPTLISLDEAAQLLRAVDGGESSIGVYATVVATAHRYAAPAWLFSMFEVAFASGSYDPTVPPGVRREVDELIATARHRVAGRSNIFKILGSDARDEGDESKSSLAHLLAVRALKRPSVRRRLCRMLRDALEQHAVSDEETASLRSRLLGRPELLRELIDVWCRRHPPTTTAIADRLSAIATTNLHFVSRPPGVRNKASALNFGLMEAERRGWATDGSYVVVIDSDSLLQINALAVTASEIERDPEKNVIRQLLPITANNFNGRNWFVRTVIAADSMAAAGRWASNVRTQSRADLTAGSGIVIPIALLRYLKSEYGQAWDTTIICEDARLILSQYGILDGATKRTKMVPAFLLEGAPERSGVWDTYVAFWRQRIRWAVGGFDEVIALCRTPLTRILVNSNDFSALQLGQIGRLLASARRLRLAGLWLADHLWWSGIGLAPWLWIVAEKACGAPPWVLRVFGCVALVGAPTILLGGVFLPIIGPLIPGGLRRPKLTAAHLAVCLLATAGPYVWPVIVAQLMHVTGVRSRLGHWNPSTPKPRL